VDFTRPRPRVSRASRPRVTRASRPPTRWGSVPSGLRPSLPTACRGRPARQQGGAPSRRDCAPAYRLRVAGILPARERGHERKLDTAGRFAENPRFRAADTFMACGTGERP